jgi:glutaminyl-tRNA synthetase
MDNKQIFKQSNFIKDIIADDMEKNKHNGIVKTRFPPEPNGYLHIGHAKSICLNFGIAQESENRTCNLRFDDTNPSKEDIEYVESIKEDIRWLGFKWDNLHFASDYFDLMYKYAVELIKNGKAYVCDLTSEQTREYRGTFEVAGKNSPYRDRSVEENLELFEKMKNGEFNDGEKVLKAKIDMSSPNMNLRDPAVYRIKKENHHRTGDKWCIYPMYDWAHGLEDSIENITHSLCTLEFENHRPLYDWFLDNISIDCHPRQIEFARLNLTYTVMSKRKLLDLINAGVVNGWDDPRMPTISGLKRRGYTPESIRTFCDQIGVSKRDGIVDVSLLEYSIREDLNRLAPRVMAVSDPLKVIIDNFPEDEVIYFDSPYHPGNSEMGTRKVPFSKIIYIEKDDFNENPPKKWFRLSPGKEIRLRYACLIKCVQVIKDEKGEIVELHCTWDPESKGGKSPDGRKVRGTSHWVSAKHALNAELRMYDRLFNVENPMDVQEGENWMKHFNENSLVSMKNCKLEPSLESAKPGEHFQFERVGYFVADNDSTPGNPVFNRTITLKDSWSKKVKQQPQKPKQQVRKVKPLKEEITIDDFSKLDLRVGIIKEAVVVEEARKLLKIIVDIGEEKSRQIFAGIRSSYSEPSELVGTRVIVIANLKARQMKFGLSEGMIIAGGNKKPGLAIFEKELLPGDIVS